MSSPWPHNDNASLIAFYGDPQSRLFALNLIPFIPPWQMYYKDDNGLVTPVKHFVTHKKCHDSLMTVFIDLWGCYQQDQKRIESIGLQWYGGCYAPRNVRGSTTKLSCHAFAAAIDLDPENEPMNHSHINKWPQEVIDAFKAEGWFWGGDFISRQDPMHFQCAYE